MTRTPLIWIFGVALCCLPIHGWADARDDLKAGKILEISVPGEGIWPGKAIAVINASAAKVLEIVKNFSNYYEFIPHIITSRQIKEGLFFIEGQFPWPVNKPWAHIEVTTGQKDKIYYVSWKMIEGSLKEYNGIAWIQPWGDKKCVITYQMLAIPAILAPHAIMTSGLKKAVGKVVNAIRERVMKSMTNEKTP